MHVQGPVCRALRSVVCVLVSLPAMADPCALEREDRAWAVSALEAWSTTAVDALKTIAQPLPEIILFDASCRWHINPASIGGHAFRDHLAVGGRSLEAFSAPHQGAIVLPDGEEIPAQIVSFAGTGGEPTRPFFVMALPSIWRAEERFKSDPRLGSLMRGVLAHEMTHTLQAAALGARLDELEASREFPGGLDDDVVQRVFSERDGYREAYERERDLLFSAATIDDDQKARARAREALEALDDRRERFMSGDEQVYAELDDLFLMMEGVANWAAVRASSLEMSEDEAIDLIRRGGRFWTQDEGLALFLVIDRFVPEWQKLVFRDEPAALRSLLELAGGKEG